METGAEERVDNDVGTLDDIGLDGLPTRVAEHAGRDPAVTAVRAAAADDGEAPRVREHAHGLVRDARACALHQLGDVPG